MAFPDIPLAKVKADLSRAFQKIGRPAAFTLRDGTQFTVQATDGFRRSLDLTDGLDVSQHIMRVLADDWDTRAPRMPEKGDRLTYDGRRYAVQEDVRARGVGMDRLVYVFVIKG